MQPIKQIKSSKITWDIMQGEGFDEWETTFCADGDGILQVIVYKDIPDYSDKRIELVDQLEVVKTWYDVDGEEELLLVLEEAQKYLAATYHEIYELALHGE
jgi:hypothetical protein